MLSVILYGRNDSHGYNLHKRAAISLNAIAHLLSDPADEIIFVDYNTPDDLPTFPEAIADTLTAKAVEKLRILRVRPAVHNARYAAKTHLVALEPIARNVAIRRSNPANKWVLSTNTDMIFVPRTDGGDLTSAIGALKDGFYHLPRFELPEGLWETLDRKDPVGLIQGAREWGERFHLNEVILSGNDNLYDGPGDFQLFLRDDLFAIGGFHEEMIRGWHLDANVARRMRMLRGKVSSALDALIGYHCDHTRQATAYHKGDRVENSAAIFVDNIYEPQIRDQMEGWGLPDVQIEELKLGQASGARYLRGLEAAVQGRLEGFLEAEYVPEAYGRLGYDPDHVLPYLLDLVSCIPEDVNIAWVGGRSDMFAAFAKAWAAMGGTRPVSVPDTAPWLGDAGGAVRPIQQWLDEAELFIFEVGVERPTDQSALTDGERARLWAVDHGFKLAAQRDRERQAKGAAPRRALIINGVHNFFETQVFAAVSVTLTPFSSRIRHGYFVDAARAAAARADDPARRAGVLAGRAYPFGAAELTHLRALTKQLKGSAGDGEWRAAARIGADIQAAVDAGVPGLFEGGGRPASEMLQRLADLRPSKSVRAVSGLIAPEAGAGAASRLVRLEDWDNPAWADLGRLLFEARLTDILTHKRRWGWERITLAQNLFARFPLGSRPKVLLVGDLPDTLALALAGLEVSVDLVSAKSLAEGRYNAADWRREFNGDGWMPAAPLGLASDRDPSDLYDAAIASQNALLGLGRADAATILRNAVKRVKPGGHVGFCAPVQLIEDDARPTPLSLAPGLVHNARIVDALEALVDMRAEGGVDLRLTPATFDRLSETEFPGDGPPALAVGAAPHIETTAVFAFTKGERTDDGDWSALSGVFTSGAYSGAAAQRSAPRPAELAGVGAPAAPALGGRYFTAADVAALAPVRGRRSPAHFGPIFDRLKPMDGVSMTPLALKIPSTFGEELAALADVGELSLGGYELQVEARVSRLAGPSEVIALGVAGGGRLVGEVAQRAEADGLLRMTLSFDIDEDLADIPDGLRLGVKGMGNAEIEVLEVVLR